jgi:hypothetical protein
MVAFSTGRSTASISLGPTSSSPSSPSTLPNTRSRLLAVGTMATTTSSGWPTSGLPCRANFTCTGKGVLPGLVWVTPPTRLRESWSAALTGLTLRALPPAEPAPSCPEPQAHSTAVKRIPAAALRMVFHMVS